MPSRSLTARTSLLFTLLAAGVFLVMGVFIRASVQHHFGEQDRIALEGKLELIRHILDGVKSPEDRDRAKQQLEDALVGHHDLSVRVRDGQGRDWLDSGHVRIPDALLANATALVSAKAPLPLLSWRQDGEDFRGLVTRLEADGGVAASLTVAIATDTRHHASFLAGFERELLAIGVGGLLLMAAAGWWATRRGFRPVLHMARVAEGISAQRLDERLPDNAMPTELQPLARAFNAMLDRLAESLQRLSAFSSDIAHELRTPVNNLMTQTQVSLSKLRSHDEYREVLYSNLEEFERLGRMISDMLFLAKAENGLVIPEQRPVDMRTEIEALFEFYDALAADKQLTLTVDGEGRTVGDALMLRRAFSNLLSNAIRHADAGSTVRVDVQESPAQLTVTVGNTGDTILPEHLPRLFDRFYRADASRQRQDDGVGLGLAITRSILQAHGGAVTVSSSARQTCFRVGLPMATHSGQTIQGIYS